METLKRTYRQFLDLYKSMSPSQRGTLIVVPVMVVAAFGFLMFSGRSSSYVPLSWGKVFTTEEQSRAEQTLIDAGLTDFRREGQRILVPKSEVDRYNAALVDGGGLPSNWAEELEKVAADSSPFVTNAQVQARIDAILGKHFRRVVRALPDIEDGDIKWARSKPGRWPNNQRKVTATVTVRPRPGRELSKARIESLRYAAAGMVPDLKPENVTVLNQTTFETFTGDGGDGPLDGELLEKIREYEQQYEKKVRAVLSYIPGVLVSANVDPEKLQRYTERKKTVEPKPVTVHLQEERRTSSTTEQPSQAEPGPQANQPRQLQVQNANERAEQVTETNSETTNVPSVTYTEKDYIAAMPESVQVAISIPRAYARTVALHSKSSAADQSQGAGGSEPTLSETEITAAEDDVKTKVEKQVAKLIPSGSPADAVDVSFHVPGEPETEPVETGVVESVGEMAGRWGGAIGLGLFALWALWMLHKSMSRLPSDEEPDEPGSPQLSVPPSPEDDHEQQVQEEIAPIESTKRDKVQTIVRDNPEMAAAVLSKWMQSPK